jgi:hypothetical protein
MMITAAIVAAEAERERELALPGRERAVEADAWNTITRLIGIERRAVRLARAAGAGKRTYGGTAEAGGAS